MQNSALYRLGSVASAVCPAIALGVFLFAGSARAQAPQENAQPPAAQPDKPPEGDAQAPDGRQSRKPQDKAPQTAEEKSKLLSDLYAHLAAADDEEAAKKVTTTIERLWLYSGSDTIDLLMQRSTKAIAEKKYDLAQKLLDSVIALAPDYAEGFNRRAYLSYLQDNFESAVGDLRRTLALEPNHYKALEGLAQIWRETGNKKGALRVMQQLLDVNPFASNAKQTLDELQREVDGQGI